MKKVAVVGLGKVGHPLATVLQRHGFQVYGVEVSEERYKQLVNEAKYQIFKKTGEYLQNCDFVFMIVQTPSLETGKFDLKYVENAIKSIKQYLRPNTVIAVCSTINVGDIQELQKHWSRIAYTPLMIAQGRIERDLEHPEYVLIGSDHPQIMRKLRWVWQQIVPEETPFIQTSARNMEIIKLTFNFWLPAKISLLNSTAIFCEKYSGNYREVANALKHDKRLAGERWWDEFGGGAGIGFGGPCFPRDVRNWEVHLPDNVLVKAVEKINLEQVERSIKLIESLNLRKIVFLGITYKAGTNLVIESQAIKIIEGVKQLNNREIMVYDPTQPGQFKTAEEAIKEGDIIFIAVPWQEFAELQPHNFRKNQIVIDPWRILVDKKLPCKHYAFGIGLVKK